MDTHLSRINLNTQDEIISIEVQIKKIFGIGSSHHH